MMDLTEESFQNYRDYHEYFMMNHNGTSLLESAIALTPPPSALLLWSVVLPALVKKSAEKECMKAVFLLEFVLLVLPLVLCFTVFSNYILVVSLSLIFMFTVLIIGQRRKHSDKSKSLNKWLSTPTTCSRRPFITIYRAYTNVITCICILAVDFRVFPRRFSKTEVSGYGLMDTGAGLFVVANALVSYKTLGKQSSISLRLALKSSSPLLVLGLMRLLATYLLNYQEHVSEYGTHWNFFFTLAATRLLSAMLLSIFGSNFRTVVFIFISLATAHEFSLSFLGIKDWAVSSKVVRLDFITSNREGLISLVGYLCLHFGGTVTFGRICSRPRLKIAHWISLWKELSASSVFMWLLTHVLHECFGVSRRVADLGYICWVLAYSLSSLTFFLTVELIVSAINFGRISEKQQIIKNMQKHFDQDNDIFVPHLFKAVNYNGLAYFLLGNILTGLVNLSLKPLTITKWPSILIINLYMLVTCIIIHILYVKKVQLKFW